MRARDKEGEANDRTFGCALFRVTFESGREHTSQLLVGLLVSSLVGPCLTRFEKLGGNTFEGCGDGEVENGRLLEFALGKGTIVDGVDNLSGDLEGASLSSSEGSSSPTVMIEK